MVPARKNLMLLSLFLKIRIVNFMKIHLLLKTFIVTISV